MDERPLKLLERAPEPVREPLKALASHAGSLAENAGVDLQFEFGKQHIAFIVGCNQFLRLMFRGDHAGDAELPGNAGVEGEPALEQVFRMFGWVRLPADTGLIDAVSAAFAAANTKGAPKLTG